jgi:integrase
MRGSTYKRCACKDAAGRRLGARCPQLRSSRHGSWYFVAELPADARGRRRQLRRGGFASEREARSALDRVITQAQSSRFVETLSLTVGEYLREWLAAKGNLRPSTRRSYRQHIDLHLIPHIGEVRLTSLRGTHVEHLLQELRGGENPMGVATSRRVFATLRVALNKAMRQGLIASNPCALVELESETDHRTPATVWTPAEVRQFLDAAREQRLYAMYVVVITCGLRRGEVIGLRWDDVDLDNALLVVHRSVIQLGGHVLEGSPKTKRSTRVVPLDAGTVKALQSHRRRQAQERLALDEEWGNLVSRVFTRRDGSGLVPEHVSRQFKALAARAGVPVIRFHDLRHTSASLALTGGVPMRVVSERLGHSTIAITSDLYTKVYDETARDAAERIARVINIVPPIEPSAESE